MTYFEGHMNDRQRVEEKRAAEDDVTLEKLTDTCFVLNVKGMEVAIVEAEFEDGPAYVILSKDGKILMTFFDKKD